MNFTTLISTIMTQKNIKFGLVALVLLMNVQWVMAQKKVLVDTEKVYQNIKKIEIEGGVLEVEYLGDPNLNQVEVSAFLESNQHDQDIVFVTIGDVLKIKHQSNDNFRIAFDQKTYGLIKIKGPQQMEIISRSGSGKSVFENVKAENFSLAVGSGIIEGRNLTGNIQASAGSGTIKLTDVKGDVNCKVGSGNVSLNQISGAVKSSISSGSLRGNQLDNIQMSISSGSAKLENIKELGDLSVSSGSIRALNSGLGKSTKLNASSGSIKIQTPNNLDQLNYNMKASSGSIKIGNTRVSKQWVMRKGDFPEINGIVSSGSIAITN
jgi:lia operon protein LiaG